MTRRTAWTAAFVTITAAAVGMELYAATDGSEDTDPWTYLIVDHLPASVIAAAIAALTAWLAPHFAAAYRNRRGVDMPDPLPPAPDPDEDHPREPLFPVAAVTALAAAAVDLIVAFGVHLSDRQTGAIVTVVTVAVPVVVYAWGRRRVYSPDSVARLLAAAPRAKREPTP